MLLGSMFIIVSSLVLMTDKENENKFFKYLFKVGRAWFKFWYILFIAALILVPIIWIVAFMVGAFC